MPAAVVAVAALPDSDGAVIAPDDIGPTNATPPPLVIGAIVSA